MAKYQPKSLITADDIRRRHPKQYSCETDREYAQLANDFYDFFHERLSFMKEEQIRNTSINMTLFFEDMRSGLHLFETFTRMYQKMYGCYLPFYDSADANAPEAELDAMRFRLWHSCGSEREGTVLNPKNDAFKESSATILDFWNRRKVTLPPNEELANYLYSEETQTDANEIKMVLIWLSFYCPLGRWFNNPTEADQIARYKHLMRKTDKGTILYAADCYTLFDNRTWPLSVTPQHVYSEMIRIDMDDPNDELAEVIERIEGKPFGIYKVLGFDGRSIRLKDFIGNVISVNKSDFYGSVDKPAEKSAHLSGSFFCFNGVWYPNGPSLWSMTKENRKEVDKELEKLREQYHYMHDYAGQYDDFIRQHDGERLFFFRNFKEYKQWLRDELKTEAGDLSIIEKMKNNPMVVFFEDNGQTTLCLEPVSIKHPANPIYNSEEAKMGGLTFFLTNGVCSPGLLLYLIKQDLLPDTMLNDVHGAEYGRRLFQDNIDFMARCLRRDIENETVARPRTIRTENNNNAPGQGESKIPFTTFADLIASEKSIRSKANKEWQVVRSNGNTTVVRDVDNRKNFSMPTTKLYEAYYNLSEKEIQIANLIPFVGKENAPAASALLYNIVGKGRMGNSLRKLANDVMKNGGGF